MEGEKGKPKCNASYALMKCLSLPPYDNSQSECGISIKGMVNIQSTSLMVFRMHQQQKAWWSHVRKEAYKNINPF